MIKVSVVIPVYNAAQSLEELVNRLTNVFEKKDNTLEVIFVDDCSPDNSWLILNKLKKKYPSILRIVRLSVNSGQHNATLCGMSFAQGDIIVTMDDDLQHHPEDIPHLLKPILEDHYELVIGSFQSKQHHVLRNTAGKLIDYLQRRIFSLPKGFQLTSFRAIKKSLAQNAQQTDGIYPYLTAILLSLTTRYANVPVRHDERHFEKTNYNFANSLSLAANLILTYSSYPLYFVAALSFLAFSAAGIFGVYIIYKVFIGGVSVPGWSSIIVLISTYNALIFLVLFIVSLYLARMNRQISKSKQLVNIAEFYE